MILVIADDITGAAECAALGLRFGLESEVRTELVAGAPRDLVVLDAATRSCRPEEAVRTVDRAARIVADLRPERVYKKIDSTLRGHVRLEIEAFLERSASLRKAVVVPANPSAGRVVRGGRYFVDGRPLHRTDLAHDPEFPAASSEVADLLGRSGSLPVVVAARASCPRDGLVTPGETASRDDLEGWASVVDDETLPAGGSEFLSVLLERWVSAAAGPPREASPEPGGDGRDVPGRATLRVCGSSTEIGRRMVRAARSEGYPVSTMPSGLFRLTGDEESLARAWTEEVRALLAARGKALVAIDRPPSRDPGAPARLSRILSLVVAGALRDPGADEVFVEGGATASAVVRRMGWTRLEPCAELAPGVVRLRLPDRRPRHVTLKPGNRPWPPEARFD
jgi:uncharacterized protein YgbK (DUF1537 family)